MASLLSGLGRTYQYVFVELADPRFLDYPLMGSPVQIVLILAAYLYFVTSLGPRLMRNRPPFKLDRVIQVYDAVQIALSFYVFERSMTLAWLNNYSLQCEPVDYSMEPSAYGLGKVGYVFFLTKVMDLLDTVFFVLRKKSAQVSFLHVYHHTLMVLAVWSSSKYFSGGHATMVGTINAFVHVVMYSYYLLTSVCPEQKANLWWKKHITQLQMVQFVLLVAHSGQMLALPGCGFPKLVSALLILPQNVLMFYLFAKFYRKAYLTPKHKTR